MQESSFFEQFNIESLSESSWVVSSAFKKDSTPYNGKWAIEEAHKYPGFEGDYGLVMKNDSLYYAISKTLPKAIPIENEDLVVQYEVKFQKEISCSGAYIKLLSGEIDSDQFSDASDFQIRFGPDICGSKNKVDFALKKAVDNEDIVSCLSEPPIARTNLLSNLYTLIVRPNREIEIRINGEVAKAGNLYESKTFMTPPLDEMAFIPDTTAEKPADWDDREFIIDESVQKPADYDEKYASMWIANPDIKMPAGWNEDETIPKYIRDPLAVKPAEWNDEEDGEWIAPFIKNPLCVPGCGKWEAPKIVNKDYKGEWVAPSIENPNYQGDWTPPLVKNPAVTTTEVLSKPISGIGFDLWTMQSGIMFNNIYVGNSVAEAEKIGNETFIPKLKLERGIYELTKPKAKHEPVKPPQTFEDILNSETSAIADVVIGFIQRQLMINKDFWEKFQMDPLDALISNPLRFIGSCVIFLVGFVSLVVILNVSLFLLLGNKLEAETSDREARAKLRKETEDLDKLAEELFNGSSSAIEESGVKSRKPHEVEEE